MRRLNQTSSSPPTTAPRANPTAAQLRLPPAPSSTPVPRPSLPFQSPPAQPSHHPKSAITPLSSMHSPHEELIRSIQGKQQTIQTQHQPQPPLGHHTNSTNNNATPKILAATLGDLPYSRSKTQGEPLVHPQALYGPSGDLPIGSRSKTPPPFSRHRGNCSSWLMRTITRIINSQPGKQRKPPFTFELSEEAAEANFAILQQHNMSLAAVISSSDPSPISYGSEFKPTNVLEPLFQNHPGWTRMKKILQEGSDYHLEPIDEAVRLEDLKGRLEYGNHKSAQGARAEILATKMEKEVVRGWTIPLLPHHVWSIPESEAAPMGLANQAGINERGEIVYKDRVTHDMGFPGTASESSVNDRVKDEELAKLQYGHMLSRVIHYIVECRTQYPNHRILMRKDDFKSAYRRQHLSARAAVKTITQIIKGGVTFLLLALRLTFGGKPGPSEWCTISEPICDLATAILNCEDWDPSTTQSPHQAKIPAPVVLDASIPFTQGKPMMVDVPLEPYGKCDQFIDDTLTIGIDFCEAARRRLEAAAPLATFIVAREICEKETVVREDILSFEKMLAEGGLVESLTVLGWILDTRRLLISLPPHKYIAWTAQIDTILKEGFVTKDALVSLIGRLNHAAMIIPLARHFLGRIRALETKATNKWLRIYISKRVRKDLELWKAFLTSARDGISMNLLTFREPTKIYRSDACEYGLGGFNSKGRAWRWQIPEHLLGRAHIGLLEFLAEVVNLWMDIIKGDIEPEDCALIMGDSTNAIGWVHKSKFIETDEDKTHDQTAKLRVARKLASLSMQHSVKLYSQWFPGEDNIIPDILSPTPQLQTSQGPGRDRLVSLLRAAGVALQQATCEATQAKRIRAWRLWREFLPSIGIEGDDYLAAFTPWHRQVVCTAFCQAVREGLFSSALKRLRGRQQELVKGTVTDTLSFVAQAFRSAQRPDPRLDVDGNTCYLLQQVFRGYSNQDPATKPQKALPFSVLSKMMELAQGVPLATAIAELAMGAWFFAMRSCEYTKTSTNEESKRTKILRLRNIRFFLDGTAIPHSSPSLHLAAYVDITFEYQKNDERNESVGMYGSKKEQYHAVSVWASIVRRVWSYDNSTLNTTVNTFQYYDKQHRLVQLQITSQRVRTKIRSAAKVIGESTLGFHWSELGTHSIRSGAAMALYLAQVPTLTIMIIGRWKSDAFLRYIRKQVSLFSQNLTDKMLQTQHFFTTPDFDRASAMATVPQFTTEETENGPSRHWGTHARIPTHH